jgi:8-oxo-dGTP pyrophosphatase MutT (NUDIX family)/phosphohistidine phosphatase SixA
VTGEGAPLVRAAGALCWHRGPDGLQVLLVHRPRYGDWSWPKGKLEGDEPAAAAAVREVREETGVTVALGVPLPSARYPLGPEASKHVSYWAAHVQSAAQPPPPRPEEVDATAWVGAAEADRRLTRRADRVQLRALLDADAEGALETWPLLVLRHAHAHPRRGWGGSDDLRPLSFPGMAQAQGLPELLAAWSPLRVVSSPAERCVQTVEPYLYASGTRLRTKTRISEEGHRRSSAAAAAYTSGLLAKGRPVLVCTHRPVLPTLLGTLAGHASAGVADAVPRADPYLEPGEVLVAHVSRRSGRVVAVERHQPVPW